MDFSHDVNEEEIEDLISFLNPRHSFPEKGSTIVQESALSTLGLSHQKYRAQFCSLMKAEHHDGRPSFIIFVDPNLAVMPSADKMDVQTVSTTITSDL
jgi:hypothetical protein